MATVNKNFKVKNGLVVEGTVATVNGNQVLTVDTQATDTYILNLVGGVAFITSTSGDFDVVGGELRLDRTQVDTYYDAAGAAASAYTDSKSYVDGKILDYTKTSDLDTTVGGYGYLKSADLPPSYSDSDVDAHLSGGNGIDYASGTISTRLGTGLEIDGANQIAINRTTTDTWYDVNGAADTVQTNLTNHRNLTSAHGVTGDVVGTTDSQTLTNKRIVDDLTFGYNGVYITSDVDTNGDVEIGAASDIKLASSGGDILLNPALGHHAYVGGVTAGNEVATHSYVDNAVSGLNWKQAVNLLSTTNVDISGVGPAFPIDGHAMPTTDYRILLTGQSTGSENGIWLFNALTQSFSRPADADTHGELVGAAVFVMEGTTYGGSSWVQSNHYLSDFTGQDWTQFSGSGTVTAGNGITVNGLEVSVNPYDFIGNANDPNYIELGIKNGDIGIDKSTLTNYTNTLYDASGAASTVQSNLEDHASDSITHGVTGNIVGTTDSQIISNKTFTGATLFDDNGTPSGDISGIGANLRLKGMTDLTLQAKNGNVVLAHGGAGNAYVDQAIAGNEIATEGYVDAAVAGVTIDLSGAAGTNIDWNPTTEAFDVNVTDVITSGNIATNTSVASDITTAIDAITTDVIEEGTINKYASTTNVVAALTDQPSIIDLGTTELSADKFSGGDVSGVQGTFQNVRTDTIYSDNLSMQRNSVTGSIATADTVGVLQIGAPTGRAIKVMIKLTSGSHAHVWEALLAIDASQNVAVTEYAEITTNGVLGSLSYPVLSDGKGGYYINLTITTLNSDTNYKILSESF